MFYGIKALFSTPKIIPDNTPPCPVNSPSIEEMSDISSRLEETMEISPTGLRKCFHDINTKNMADRIALFEGEKNITDLLTQIFTKADEYHQNFQSFKTLGHADYQEMASFINKSLFKLERFLEYIENIPAQFSDQQKNALESIALSFNNMTDVDHHSNKPISIAISKIQKHPIGIPLHIVNPEIKDFLCIPSFYDLLTTFSSNTQTHAGFLASQAALFLFQTEPLNGYMDIYLYDQGRGVSAGKFDEIGAVHLKSPLSTSPLTISNSSSKPKSGEGLYLSLNQLKKAGYAPTLFTREIGQAILIQGEQTSNFPLPDTSFPSGFGVRLHVPIVPIVPICKIGKPDFKERPLRVLMIEDSITAIKGLKQNFNHYQFSKIKRDAIKFTEVSNKEELDEALDAALCAHQPYHAYLVDNGIPGVDIVLEEYFNRPTLVPQKEGGAVIVATTSDKDDGITLVLTQAGNTPIFNGGKNPRRTIAEMMMQLEESVAMTRQDDSGISIKTTQII